MSKKTDKRAAMLDALHGLRWPARSRVAAAAPGAQRSRKRGSSGEFTEYRLYRQGDDPRSLDWRLLARSDRAFVRVTDERALLVTWLLLDASASMNFPIVTGNGTSKWDQASAMAVGLAAVVHAGGDPVGLIVSGGGRIIRIPPRSRRKAVQEMAQALDSVSCGGGDQMDKALSMLSPNTRIVCISDWLGNLKDTMRAASVLARAGAQIDAVHIVAQEELEPPSGTHRVEDPEPAGGGPAAAADLVLSRQEHKLYTQNFAAFRKTAREGWQRLGAGYTEVLTSDDAARMVRAIVTGSRA